MEEGVMTRYKVMKTIEDYTSYLASQYALVDSHVPKVQYCDIYLQQLYMCTSYCEKTKAGAYKLEKIERETVQ